MTNSVQEVAEDVLLKVLQEEVAEAIPRLMVTSITTLAKIIIAKMLMLIAMLEFQVPKFMEEVQEANASLAVSAHLAQALPLLVSASNTLALALDQALSSRSKLAQGLLSARKKARCQLVDIKAQSTALIL